MGPIAIAAGFAGWCVVSAPGDPRTGSPSERAEAGAAAAPRVDEFASRIRALVESGAFVGAEVYVERRGEVLLHEAWGWKDRESGVRLETGTIYSIRSMTKPMAGTVIQQLVDEGTIDLDAPVASYLPEFDREGLRDLSIEHLLIHRSGFPQSDGILTWWDEDFEDVGDIAGFWAARGPDVPPGSAFVYADANADILGAVVGAVTGQPIDEVMRERVIDPLAMHDTLMMVNPDEPKRKRIASAYRQSGDAWERFWTPEDPPLFRYPMYAQSAYSTCQDYATFMWAWLREDEPQRTDRVVSSAARTRALRPHETLAPAPMEGILLEWGHMWGLVVDDHRPRQDEILAFGHGGSDGTMALAFPASELIIVFCSQSRGATGDPVFAAILEHLAPER